MTIRDALNSALDEELANDKNVFVMGEEVRTQYAGYQRSKRCRFA